MDDWKNITFVGVEGLMDRVVIEVAESFRSNLRKWVKNVNAGNEIKAQNAIQDMWIDLTWFLSGNVEEMYPNEEVNGGIFYERLYDEWVCMQDELNVYVAVPSWVQFMEDDYYATKQSN